MLKQFPAIDIHHELKLFYRTISINLVINTGHLS